MNDIELLHTFEVRIWPYFPRRNRVKFGQYAPNECEVTILSNDWNESYCFRCISTFQLFEYPQKLDNIVLLHTFEVRIWPYFPRRSRVKFGQYAPNGCEVTILSNDWNESYCYRCISTFQLFKYPQKLDNILST